MENPTTTFYKNILVSFNFKQFTIHQTNCAQRVSTDACIFGAWVTERLNNPAYVLDIGAGTGVLMLMIAQRSKAIIDGIEIEENCFTQLEENLSSSPFATRVNAIHGDVKTHRFLVDYDLIVSNPPYYENQLTAEKDQKKLAWHSSMLRLEELFQVVQQNLSEKGIFAIILPFSRKDEAIKLAEQVDLFPTQITYVRHSAQHAFTRVLMLFSKESPSIQEEIIDIKNENDQYSDRMVALLDDYYLNIKG